MTAPCDFTPDPRRAMTPARRHRIWMAWGGKCWFCNLPVPESGPAVEYDHIPALWMKGSDADEDIGPIHKATCHKVKTAADASRRAKVKRIHKWGEPKKGRKLQGAGFDKSLSKGFDGKVRPRS
jgi:hypothetical protein